MLESGCNLKEIPSAKYKSVETSHAAAVIEALKKADIQFHAKYDDKKLILAYSSADEDKVGEILARSSKENADLIERLRTEGASQNDYASLLPEIAEVMGVSTGSLENRPLELRLYLAQAYIDSWFSDKATIQKELERVTELGYYAKKDVGEYESNITGGNDTPEKIKESHDEQQQNITADKLPERSHQQRETTKAEEARISFFTVEKLRREARRIKKSASENSAQEHELTETEDIIVRKK